MSAPVLTAVVRTQGNTAALKSRRIVPEGFALAFEEVPVLVHAFRRMVRAIEFDVCEMALTTYLCAREYGIPFTALPVFLVRAFHHGAILHASSSGIRHPRELEGKRVGVNRGYTVTTGVWARSVLQDEFGVDLSKIMWVCSGDEHVEEYGPPGNVVPQPPGKTMEEMLITGELAAAIGISTKHPDIRPLIPNAAAAGLAAFLDRGHYPINHLVVVANRVLEKHSDAAVALLDAFVKSRDAYLERLKKGELTEPDESDRLYGAICALGRDPLPYGLDANRKALNDLIAHATTQGILTRPVHLESMFVPLPAS